MNHAHDTILLTGLGILSLGVLAGCEYCTPALFAVIVGKLAFEAFYTVADVLQMQPLDDI